MRVIVLSLLGLVLTIGCARVRVEAPKEPIKVDISMRLDIYQHVEKDIDAIENIVSGAKAKPQTSGGQSMLDYFIASAYAQTDLSPEVEQAALRRRDRLEALISWEKKAVIGENKLGLVEIRDPKGADPSVEQLVKAENSDRMIIYEAVAAKNGTSVEEVQKLYAKRLQAQAAAGTPIEVANEATGSSEWKTK
jgi:uncharacterized protein YdbL (DUF1318 family)